MRQPESSTRTLPSSGEKPGATAPAIMVSDSTCPGPRPEKVAGDGAGEHRGGTGAQGLDDAAQNQPPQAARHGGHHTSDHERGQASHDKAASAEPIRQRPDDQLAQGKGQEEGAEQQTELSTGEPELGPHPREGRQDDVGGERPDRSETGEEHDDIAGDFARCLES